MSNMQNKYIVVSYGTHYIQGMDDLIKSLVKHGFSYDIGGVGETWRGFVAKLEFVSNNIKKWQDQNFTHLIFVDAFDVLACGSIDEFDEKYKKLEYPSFLLAKETGCWPDSSKAALHEDNGYPWKYWHSQYVLELNKAFMLEPETYTPTTDDQNHLMCLALKNKEIKADDKASIFMALAHLDDRAKFFEKREDGRIYNKLSNESAVFVHGNSRVNMDEFK